jgi:thiol:disulfide interchange protein
MKLPLVFAAGMLCAYVALAQSSGVDSLEGIRFTSGTWKSILAQAQKEQKPIFIDVYTTWCGPCRKMDQTVFVQKTVGDQYNAAFVNYKLDAEKGEGVQLAKRYKVNSYPTYLFLNEQGELLFKETGACSATEFMAHATNALAQRKGYQPLSEMDQMYAAGNRDTAFLNPNSENPDR